MALSTGHVRGKKYCGPNEIQRNSRASSGLASPKQAKQMRCLSFRFLPACGIPLGFSSESLWSFSIHKELGGELVVRLLMKGTAQAPVCAGVGRETNGHHS